MRVVRGDQIEFTPAWHEDKKNPGVLKKVLATGEHLQAGQIQMVNWSLCPTGKSFQTHYHEDMQEVFIILNGQVSMTVDQQQVTLQRGDAVLVEPREIHKMTNCCDDDVHYVVFGISSGEGGKTVVVEE